LDRDVALGILDFRFWILDFGFYNKIILDSQVSMSFRYRIVKKSIGNSPYTTRPELGTSLSESELIQSVVGATSLTEGDIRNVLISVRHVILEAARSGRNTDILFDFFRVSLNSGGAIDDPEQSLSIDDIDPRMNIYLALGLQEAFKTNLSLERVGMAGERVPEIELVRNLANDSLDTYTPSNVLRITGKNLKINKADVQQGIFLTGLKSQETVRLEQYIDNTGGMLTALTPATIEGEQRLSVRVLIGNNLRETIYGTVLQQATL
jgi:hypothetical protein